MIIKNISLFFLICLIFTSICWGISFNNVEVLDISVEPYNTVKINWTTDIPSTGKIEYGLSMNQLNHIIYDTQLSTQHSLILKNLEYNTLYFFKIIAEVDNNSIKSKIYSFATMSPDKVNVIFNNENYKYVKQKPSGWFHNGQKADILLGSISDFGLAYPCLFQRPMKIATDGKRIILADTGNNRILIWNKIPSKINQPPDLVLGQKDFYSNSPGIGPDKLNWPVGVATDGKHLLVADTNNNRVLIWNSFPSKNGQPADVVIGAPNFYVPGKYSSNNKKRTFLWPWDVFSDGKHLIITDTRFGRVLIWNHFPTKNFEPADVILNQVGFKTPRCIAFDGKHLVIGDYTTRNAYVWNSLPVEDNQPYDFILNNKYGNIPWDVSIMDNKLFVLYDNTIGIWNKFPLSNKDAPDFILGELDFGEMFVGPNSKPSILTFTADHGGMAVYKNYILISCYDENRVLIFNKIPNKKDVPANIVLGAPDFNTNTLNKYYVIHCGTPCSDGSHLFVRDLNRIYIWKNIPDQSLAKPDIVYNVRGSWAITTFNNKLIASWKNKIAIWNKIPLDGEMPDIKLGPTFNNGESLGIVKGIAADKNYMFVSDYTNNRIYVWEGGIPLYNKSPDFFINVPEPCQISTNGKNLAVASLTHKIFIWNLPLNKDNLTPNVTLGKIGGSINFSFNLPQGVFLDKQHLFVADTRFNRVLIWNKIPTSPCLPDIVLGQDNLTATDPSSKRDRLFMPGHLWFDGSYLWINEFKFSDRLLRFSPFQLKEKKPYISSIFVYPKEGKVPLKVTFICDGFEQYSDNLSYKWMINDTLVEESFINKFSYVFKKPGISKIACIITDKSNNYATSNIAKVDVSSISSIIHIESGWSLKSIPVYLQNGIDINNYFKKSFIKTIWKWDYVNWNVWSPENTLLQLFKKYNLKVIDKLYSGEGFWIYGKKATISIPFGKEYGIEEMKIKNGWSLVGSGKLINSNSFTEFGNIISIWKWDNNTWSVWSPQNKIKKLLKLYKIKSISFIDKGEGFWIDK